MKKLLLLLVLLGGFTAFGQGTITGSLMDMDLGGPLPGANVIEARVAGPKPWVKIVMVMWCLVILLILVLFQ